MALDQTLKPRGLMTDPNALSSAPNGAMSEAANVVIRRDGIVEPRPGFRAQSINHETSLPDVPVRMLPWQDAVLVALAEETGFMAGVFVDPTDGSTLASIHDDYGALGEGFALRGVETRNNLYTTGRNGILKYTATDASPVSTGINGRGIVIGIQLTGSSGFLGIGKSVAYRGTVQRRDSNEVVVTSSPSARYAITNGGGSTRNTTVTSYFDPAEVATGDVFQLWRTLSDAAVAPGDCSLVYYKTLDATDISNGYVAFSDDVADADLGEDLYTNAGQQGALQANDPPPRVQDLALFRGSLFGADLDFPNRVILTWDASIANLDGSATGVGFRQTTATHTSGSPNLTGIGDTTGWSVGMMITGGWVPNGTTITAVGATTATMSNNATNTGVNNVSAIDVLEFDGDKFSLEYPQPFVLAVNAGTVSGAYYSVSGNPSQNYRASFVTDYDQSASAAQKVSVLIESRVPGTLVTLGINSSKPTEFNPELTALSTAHAANASYVDLATEPNGLIYSKTDQPEAMPGTDAGNLLRVGSSSHRVERILATRDALWIFKRDGIFRLTGSGPGTWRVDPFDLTTYLVAADSAVVLGSDIYAWTNRGVVRVNDSGVSQISEVTIGNLLGPAQRLAEANPINTYASTELASGWAVANQRTNEYVLMMPTVDANGAIAAPEYAYVFNTKTLAWTRWDWRVMPLHGCVFDGLYMTLGEVFDGDPALSIERDPNASGDDPSFADRVTAEIGGSILFVYYATSEADVYDIELSAAITGYTPAVGDIVVIGLGATFSTGYRAVITALDATNPTTEFTIYSPEGIGDDAKFYEGYGCDMKLVAKIDRNANSDKMWRDGVVTWGKYDFMERYNVSFTSSTSQTESEHEVRISNWPNNVGTIQRHPRFWVPRAHSKAYSLNIGVNVTQAGAAFEFNGIALLASGGGSRSRR